VHKSAAPFGGPSCIDLAGEKVKMMEAMHTHRLTRVCQRGQSATPILVFLGIVVLSVIFFFALTLPRQLERKRATAETARAEAARVKPAAQARARDEARAAAAAEANATESSKETDPTPTPADLRFASPRQFMEVLAAHLTAGDVAAAESMLGAEALAGEKASFFRALFTTAGMRPSAVAPVREIGDVAELYRWSVRLDDGQPSAHGGPSTGDAGSTPAPNESGVPAGPSAIPAIERVELEVDIVREPTRGWRAAAVHYPEPLRGAVAAKLGAGSVPPVIAGAAEDAQDPLKIAGHFLRAVLKQDFAVARGVTDTEQVTREKVAGLCILFEEGAYTIAEHRPLSATAAGNDAAWVIVKVRSGRDGHESDFGLELRRLASGAWQVAGINFSKMLASYAASAGATEGVAYSPIVKNPSGGESLVVYFDFNEAGLVPRARRQLEIVANLLRDDPRRKLRLSGHADAIGSDTYNRRLSAARALAVKETLASLGVSPQQIVTEGLGTLRPLDPNTKPDGSDNPEGRSRNRRTEIFLDF
jgi:outer membrane protein OmpA-like peptidoglycan-associated protein